MTRKLRVFLCHASQDKPVVRELFTALKSEDWIDPWLDKAKILPGQDWEMVIEKAVDDADVIIVCLSNQSVAKEDGYVQWEIRYAYDCALLKPENTIFLIPLKLDDCLVPRKLKPFQWVDYFGPLKQEAYSDLLKALQLRYEQKVKQEVTPPPVETTSNLPQEDEKAKREAEEKATLQKAQQEAQARAKRESDEAAARERARREQQQQEFARKAILEKKQRESAQKTDKYAAYSLPMAIGGFGLLFLIAVFMVIVFLAARWLPLPGVPVHTATPVATETAQEATPSPLATQPSVATESPTASPTLVPGSSMTGDDGMILRYVPAGEFTMGSNKGDPDEKPVHTVNLDAFWIDQTEVTNKMYSLCVAADVCKLPEHKGSSTHTKYYGSLEFDDYPVIYVDWAMAKAYCKWAGRDLPTESQWEKAARGPDARAYPWGNTFDGTRLNFCDANCSSDWAYKLFNDDYAEVAPVGNYPTGQSVYGALDMAGNVWEWVNDWYDVYPDGDAGASSSFGQKYRVLRGGSWLLTMRDVRSTNRYWVDAPISANYFTGFRCAFSP